MIEVMSDGYCGDEVLPGAIKRPWTSRAGGTEFHHCDSSFDDIHV